MPREHEIDKHGIGEVVRSMALSGDGVPRILEFVKRAVGNDGYTRRSVEKWLKRNNIRPVPGRPSGELPPAPGSIRQSISVSQATISERDPLAAEYFLGAMRDVCETCQKLAQDASEHPRLRIAALERWHEAAAEGYDLAVDRGVVTGSAEVEEAS